MPELPAKKRILIWGKTRPELSSKYREIVCTGGVLEDTGGLVRLYPIPLRYLSQERRFRKYEWIEARIQKPTSDLRPESYKIDIESIVTREQLKPWPERAKWILRPGNVFDSVEELQDRQSKDRTSLGLVRPHDIRIRSKKYSRKERDTFHENYEKLLRQMKLPVDSATGKQTRPLAPPHYKFVASFRCEGPQCLGHNFSIRDWEVDALFARMRIEREFTLERAAQAVEDRLRVLLADDKDVRFFLGNINRYPDKFTIVGLWHPPKPKKSVQRKLFA